ncbi:patatin-like phospholipase family protein [Skermania piniformis]|uniref:patatin-like phospholipase family protein n=1 Tax=Skermania pinensis TaxID=39122 RepID=UPI000A4D605C|nr:patatin-like phospholipase family protein [Skermania piniformis]
MRRGLVLGCGGTVGGAWQVGALAALAAALDWDPRTADTILGTSAGGTAAAMLGSGVAVDEMVAAQLNSTEARPSLRRFFGDPPAPLPALPFGLPSPRTTLAGLRRGAVHLAAAGFALPGRTDAGFLNELIDDLLPFGGWAGHPSVGIVATDADSGQRVAFGRPGAPTVPLRDAVRASWAIPGWYPPVTLAGRRYLDGGAVSTASADLLAGDRLDEVIIVAPMASSDGARVPGPAGIAELLLRAPMSWALRREVRTLAEAGTPVRLVCPGRAELDAMGANFMDPRRRLPALHAALRHVPAQLKRSRS